MKPQDVREHLEKAHKEPAGSIEPEIAAAAPAAAPASAEALRDERIYRNISSSYFRLRRGMAVLAFAFPIALLLGAGIDEVQKSISAYYHFRGEGPPAYGGGTMRNVFVGVLWAIGTFLYFYRGYSPREDVVLDIAGFAAVGISLFPMDWPPQPDVARTLTGTIHFVSAVTFFLAIAYVCLFCSGETLSILADQEQKRRFKRSYALLGTLMIAIPATVLLIHLLSPRPERSLAVLLVEIAGIYVFSAFWWVKSREMRLIERQVAPAKE